MPFFPKKDTHAKDEIISGKTNITLLHGNCIEHLNNIQAGSIDLVVTSPPYDNIREYGNITTWDFEIFKEIAPLLYNVMKDNSVMVWVVGDAVVKSSETGTSFKQALYFMEMGFKLHDTMIYEKTGMPFSDKTRYSAIFEYMFVFAKGKVSFNPIKDRPNKHIGGHHHGTIRQSNGTTIKKIKKNLKSMGAYGIRTNIWKIANITPPGSVHPAMFPIQLAADHIKSWSNPGDIVMDPFMGSGTTGVAAKKLGRNFIGIEINPEYFKIARKKIR